MTWLFIAILAYFLFAVVSLGDRFLLLGTPNPKIYTFYVGCLGIFAMVMAPFTGFFLPSLKELLFCFFSSIFYILFLYLMYVALERFEVSRVIPATGALMPLISFLIIFALSFKNPLDSKSIAAFFLLILGSLVIDTNFLKDFSFKSFGLSFIISLFASLTFIFSKYVYLDLPFWTAFIWMRIFTFLIALLFLFSKTVRKEIVGGGGKSFTLKNYFLFIIIQILGALAFVLQNFSIALANLAYLPIVSALQGIQYIFLFIFALILPKAIKENLSRKAVLHKVSALILIGGGFVLLALK